MKIIISSAISLPNEYKTFTNYKFIIHKFVNLNGKNDQKNITKSLALSIHVYIYYPWYQSFSTWGMYSMMYIIGIRCTIVHYNLTPDWFCVKIFDLMQKMYFEMDLHAKLEFWSSYSTSSLCNWLFREQNMSAVAKQTKNSSRMLSEIIAWNVSDKADINRMSEKF